MYYHHAVDSLALIELRNLCRNTELKPAPRIGKFLRRAPAFSNTWNFEIPQCRNDKFSLHVQLTPLKGTFKLQWKMDNSSFQPCMWIWNSQSRPNTDWIIARAAWGAGSCEWGAECLMHMCIIGLNRMKGVLTSAEHFLLLCCCLEKWQFLWLLQSQTNSWSNSEGSRF